jgi:hypothetical protein
MCRKLRSVLTRHFPSFPPVSAMRAAALALALLAAAGCSKRKEPSPEFARANEIHSRLYAQELDDAYVDPRMKEAESLLQRVPPDSLDADSARQLLDRIQKNRERVEAERAERAKAVASASAPPPDPFGNRQLPQQEAAEDAGTLDAGPDVPRAGMTVDELSQRFSRCFQQGQSLVVEGQGLRDTWELKDLAVCRDLYPGFTDLVLLIVDGKVSNFGQKSAIRTEYVDAGTPAPADAGTASPP